jgi:hypothetical protein
MSVIPIVPHFNHLRGGVSKGVYSQRLIRKQDKYRQVRWRLAFFGTIECHDGSETISQALSHFDDEKLPIRR